MKEKKWRVGDRVEYRKAEGAPGSSMLNGCRGTIVYIDGQEASCTVQFDDIVPLGVTETRGDVYAKNCWYCRPDSLIAVPGRPPVKEKEGKGRKKREAGASPRPTEERGSGEAGCNVHDSTENARYEAEKDNRKSSGRREMPVWLL